MKNAARGIGGPAMAAVTTRAIVISAPLTQVRPVVESVNEQFGIAHREILLSELPPITAGGAPRTRLTVHHRQEPGRPLGPRVDQEMLRDIRDRAEGQVNGTFLAA